MDRKIKTRQVHKDIKVLDKTVTVTDHIKAVLCQNKKTVMQSTEKSSDRENNPVGYAEDAASSMLTASFTKQGIRYVDRQERLLNGGKRKLLFLWQAKKQFTSRKEQIRPVPPSGGEKAQEQGKKLAVKKKNQDC